MTQEELDRLWEQTTPEKRREMVESDVSQWGAAYVTNDWEGMDLTMPMQGVQRMVLTGEVGRDWLSQTLTEAVDHILSEVPDPAVNPADVRRQKVDQWLRSRLTTETGDGLDALAMLIGGRPTEEGYLERRASESDLKYRARLFAHWYALQDQRREG